MRQSQEVIIENPFATIGLNRQVLHGLEIKDVLALVNRLYKARMNAISDASLKKLSFHPDNTSHLPPDAQSRAATKWTSHREEVQKERQKLTDAFDKINNPAELKRILEHYRPMSIDEENFQAQETLLTIQKLAKTTLNRQRKLLTSFFSQEREHVRNCGPCIIHVRDVIGELNFRANTNWGADSQLFKDFAQHAFKKSLVVKKGGNVQINSDEPSKEDKKLFTVLRIPMHLEISQVIKHLALEALPSERLIKQAGAPETPAHLRLRYHGEGIPFAYGKNSHSRWNFSAPYKAMLQLADYSLKPDEDHDMLLVSRYYDQRFGQDPYMKVEGIIESIEYLETPEEQSPAELPTPESTPAPTRKSKKSTGSATSNKGAKKTPPKKATKSTPIKGE